MIEKVKKVFTAGTPFIWLTGGALGASLLLVIGMITLIMWNGLGFFWPADLVQYQLKDGSLLLGTADQREAIPDPDNPGKPKTYRLKIKQANRDLTSADFIWIDEAIIERTELPPEAVFLERMEWGHFYGFVKDVRAGDQILAEGPKAGFAKLVELMPGMAEIRNQIRSIETDDVGKINYEQEKIRLRLKGLKMQDRTTGTEVDGLNKELEGWQEEYTKVGNRLADLRSGQTVRITLASASGQEKVLPLDQVVRAFQPNQMGFFAKAGLYVSKVWEFVSQDPRESNTEGGVWPAIFGTVMMVLIMSIVVTPFGVLAAFYLREYAKQGTMVSIVRIAVNNLAGVPSIVFGVFGVGFFIYFVGGGIDRLFYPEVLPTPTYGTGGILWASLTLALMTVPVVIVSTEEGLAAIPNSMREGALALGATKFETTWSVVLPSVLPSVLTGLILAMARAAGEVAPLMITGVVKLAPSLPLDGYWPFMHFDRKFMHLGFHIYDVGFQSPNVDAARPMVYTTTILLLLIVLFLNVGAIWTRNRLRKRYAAAGASI